VSAKLAELNALYLDATAASDDLTGKNCNANYFRVGISDSSQVQGGAILRSATARRPST
jgi:hypothetical protein